MPGTLGMANRRLTANELHHAGRLLDGIRARLDDLSLGDRELLFALRRKVYKELSYDERSKPSVRKRLKVAKLTEQNGICVICGESLPETAPSWIAGEP